MFRRKLYSWLWSRSGNGVYIMTILYLWLPRDLTSRSIKYRLSGRLRSRDSVRMLPFNSELDLRPTLFDFAVALMPCRMVDWGFTVNCGIATCDCRCNMKDRSCSMLNVAVVRFRFGVICSPRYSGQPISPDRSTSMPADCRCGNDRDANAGTGKWVTVMRQRSASQIDDRRFLRSFVRLNREPAGEKLTTRRTERNWPHELPSRFLSARLLRGFTPSFSCRFAIIADVIVRDDRCHRHRRAVWCHPRAPDAVIVAWDEISLTSASHPKEFRTNVEGSILPRPPRRASCFPKSTGLGILFQDREDWIRAVHVPLRQCTVAERELGREWTADSHSARRNIRERTLDSISSAGLTPEMNTL